MNEIEELDWVTGLLEEGEAALEASPDGVWRTCLPQHSLNLRLKWLQTAAHRSLETKTLTLSDMYMVAYMQTVQGAMGEEVDHETTRTKVLLMDLEWNFIVPTQQYFEERVWPLFLECRRHILFDTTADTYLLIFSNLFFARAFFVQDMWGGLEPSDRLPPGDIVDKTFTPATSLHRKLMTAVFEDYVGRCDRVRYETTDASAAELVTTLHPVEAADVDEKLRLPRLDKPNYIRVFRQQQLQHDLMENESREWCMAFEQIELGTVVLWCPRIEEASRTWNDGAPPVVLLDDYWKFIEDTKRHDRLTTGACKMIRVGCVWSVLTPDGDRELACLHSVTDALEVIRRHHAPNDERG